MKRSSGVLLHVSSLWGDYSEGSFGEAAREWIDFLADCGFTYWQTLPFCFPDSANSPYKSFSAFSLNPYFIDLPMLCGIGLITPSELASAKQGTPYACEFERLNKERFLLLAKAASRMTDKRTIEEFLEKHTKTAEFCRYMALRKANVERSWDKWSCDIPAPEVLELWQFTQYMFFHQWMNIKQYANEKGVKIIGDIPIYVAWDSSDVWSAPDQFQLDENGYPLAVAGVPPDYFSAEGQLWGNPLYNWERMKSDNYTWWRERMSFMLEMFDGVRIDHFRGFEAYYSIPEGETTAKNGKWVKGPGMDFINAIAPMCRDRLVIAEDLGDITPEVEKLVHDSNFPGMRVLQFGFNSEAASTHTPHNYAKNCVAYTGTHDNNTLLGYVWELDSVTRRRVFDYCGYTGDDFDEGCDCLLRTMYQSHAGVLIMPVQDLLLFGRDTRINKPGVAHGNWSYRLTREQFLSINRDKFRYWNKLYGRT